MFIPFLAAATNMAMYPVLEVDADLAFRLGFEDAASPNSLPKSLRHEFLSQLAQLTTFQDFDKLLAEAKVSTIFIDSNAVLTAERALTEVRSFIEAEQITPTQAPRMSEDGVVSLEWKGAVKSILLVFGGDGSAAYSVKNSDGFYSDIIEFWLAKGLPPEFQTVLQTVVYF